MSICLTPLVLNPDPNDERLGLPSASEASRVINCPGSWIMRQIHPEEDSGEWAEIGNRVHAVVEGIAEMSTLSESEQTTATSIIYYRDQVIEEVFGDNLEGLTSFKERRLQLKDAEGNVIITGKPDEIIYDLAGNAILFDWKALFGEQEDAAVNVQLNWNAVMAWREFGLKNIKVAIVQPNSKGDKVSYADYNEKALANSEQWIHHNLKRVAEATREWNANKKFKKGQCVSGPSQCKYCPALGRCPATENALEKLEKDSTPVLKKMEIEKDEPTQDLIDRLPAILDACEVAEGIIKKTRAYAKAQVEQGVILESEDYIWGLQPGNKQKKFIDLVGLLRHLSAEYKFKPENFWPKTTLGIATLKEILTEAMPEGTTKKAINTEIAELVEKFGKITQNSPSLKKTKKSE